MPDAKDIGCDVLDTSGPEWSGIMHMSEDDSGPPPAVTVRNTIPDDALTAISMGGCPKIPMPVAVLAYMHLVEFNVPHLYALSEDDGFVATMMLSTDSGIYIRYDSQWHEIMDEEAIDGLNVTEVADTALATFDEYDKAGQLVQADAMMRPDGSPVQVNVTAGAAEAVTAGALLAVPQLLSRDDLDGAITAAVDDPGLQWWVSRRVRALGFADVALPWEQ